jgi:hypothetical protein
VQLVPGLKVPVEEVLKETGPMGVIFVPPLVSETVAVQVVNWLFSTSVEVQLTVVEVLRRATVNVLALPEPLE